MTATLSAPPAAPASPVRDLSPDQLARRRFVKNKTAVVGLIVLAFIIVASFIGPFFVPYSPNEIDLTAVRKAPSPEHWLGTDSTGRDVLARLMHGGQISLIVGFLAAIIAVTIGTLVGTAAGWFGGWFDTVASRVIDLMLSVPPVLVVIVLVGVLGPNVVMLVVVIAGLSWPTSARIARGVVLGLREEEFVQASKVLGSKTPYVLWRHLIPGVLPPVIVSATLLVSESILLESALSFLGAGVRPPQASWGNMLTEAQSFTVLSSMPWLWVPAGVMIAATVLATMAFGDGLRDALDPRRNQ